jgi:hypothetical protein
MALERSLFAIEAWLGGIAGLFLADTAITSAAPAGGLGGWAVAGLEVAFQHIGTLECSTAQATAVRAIRRMRASMALQVFASFVRLEAVGAAVGS